MDLATTLCDACPLHKPDFISAGRAHLHSSPSRNLLAKCSGIPKGTVEGVTDGSMPYSAIIELLVESTRTSSYHIIGECGADPTELYER